MRDPIPSYWFMYCLRCGSVLRGSHCTPDCDQYGKTVRERPAGSVRVALYVLRETRNMTDAEFKEVADLT